MPQTHSLGLVLIADDEPHILRSLGFVLGKAGYQVIEACTGREAIDSVRSRRPALVFLDIMMPEMDGLEVCRLIKSTPELASTFVILLTAKGLQADHDDGLAAGADEYMTKPFSPSKAVARVDAVLRSQSAEHD
jgi:two-component system, OmpR family, alkaline phosphatase synthesis response regulator PhoP